MRSASDGLKSYLAGNNVAFRADLLSVETVLGTMYRWTSGDTDLSAGGTTFLAPPSAPVFTRGRTRQAVGFEVDTLDVTLSGPYTLAMGKGITLAAVDGYFDGARVTLQHVIMPTWGDTALGALTLFVGNVADIEPSSTAVILKVKGELEKLNAKLPKRLYQAACNWRLYDAACGVSKPTWTWTGVVAAAPGPTDTTFHCSSIPQNPDFFVLGVVTFTSGSNAGLTRTVTKQDNSGNFTFAPPLPSAPAVGVSFSVSAGCDKSLGAKGCARYSNTPRFGGFPYIPAAQSTNT